MQASPARDLILASTSRYRSALLERLQLPFSIQAPGVDETPRVGEPTTALASRLALAKALAVAANAPHAVVIGCDQVAVGLALVHDAQEVDPQALRAHRTGLQSGVFPPVGGVELEGGSLHSPGLLTTHSAQTNRPPNQSPPRCKVSRLQRCRQQFVILS